MIMERLVVGPITDAPIHIKYYPEKLHRRVNLFLPPITRANHKNSRNIANLLIKSSTHTELIKKTYTMLFLQNNKSTAIYKGT